MKPNREEALFALASEKAPAERGPLLDRECRSDVALRARLAAHEHCLAKIEDIEN